MKQNCQKYSKTNVHFREQIHKSSLSIQTLADSYNLSTKTIRKWKLRNDFQYKSSRPHTIEYALSQEEQAMVCLIRKNTWWSLDEVTENLYGEDASKKRSSVYRTWVRNGINSVPQKEKDKAKKFKSYSPGYLHLDVTYLPKMDGHKQYLFVAIDRATRLLYYACYDSKTADNTVDFVNQCMKFFPYTIDYILTDNGLEFTNRLLVSKKREKCVKPSKLDEFCKERNIEHRHTKPSTPQTNGMVERVNGTIKTNTIKRKTYINKTHMIEDLLKFLVCYNLYRRHGGLRKELQVRTPYEAVEKWYQIEPEIFKETPEQFHEKLVNLLSEKQVENGTTL
jgi:transposase InsO family protein